MRKRTDFDLRDLARIVGGELRGGKPRKVPTGYSIDSRTINAGEIFIAIKGRSFDGHSFVPEIFKKKALCAIVSESLEDDYPCVIRVPDTLQALSDLAKARLENAGVKTIAVTGSNGKTTVKDMLAATLSEKFNVLSSIKSYNNMIGLSLSLLRLEPEHEVAVLEMGSNNPGEIRSLAEVVHPDMAVITNIGKAHLENFQDLEGVFKEKVSLLDSMQPGSVAAVNGDDPRLKKVEKDDIDIISYGFDENCSLRIREMVLSGDEQCFGLNEETYYLPVPGKHNVYNAAGCVAICRRAGMKPEEIVKGLKKVKLQPMRLERKKLNGYIFLDDSYNANPDSFLSALDVLKNEEALFKGVVCGDMMELGDRSAEMHYQLGEEIARRDLDFLIAKGSFAGSICEGATAAGMDKDMVYRERTFVGCANVLHQFEGEEVAVLVKGSREAKMEEVVKCFMSCYIP